MDAVKERAPVFAEEEVAEIESLRQKVRVEAFGQSIVMKRSEAIRARTASGVERRWLADTDAYHGRDAQSRASTLMDGLTQERATQSPSKKQARRRSTQFVQKTRQKTNAGAAHLSDLLFPTEDRNWALQPTPVPELMAAVKSSAPLIDEGGQPLPHPDKPGQSLSEGEAVADTLKLARQKCLRMQDEIDDQLVECQYNAEGRKVIDDAAQLGTGVMRGPINITRTKKKWLRRTGPDGKSFYEAEVSMDERPTSNRVDPWNCYPAPGCGEDIHTGSYFFERELISPAGLRDLAKASGFDTKAILECLKEEPTRAREASINRQIDGQGEYLDSDSFDTSNYEIWHFWGEADKDDLEALGVEVTDEMALETVSAVVVMCNERVIKAMLNPQDFGDIPYDFFIWERMTNSPWGVGVPYLMRYAQSAMNAAWRQMQDNAGLSHGPQIVMRRKGIEPADRDWELHGNKLWLATDDVQDINSAFAVFHVENNQQPLEAIFQIANQLADDETAMPQLMQGDQGEAPDKVGVARILVNGASVMLKRYARNWDDRITTPHLRRYYDWNMQYNEKEDVKGDYYVHALGSSHLVVKDQRAQDIANTAAMAQNPLFGRFINPQKLAQAQVQATAAKDVLFTDEELAENEAKAKENPPPADPRIEAANIKAKSDAQVAQMKAEGAINAEKVEAQSEIANQQLRAQEAARNDERELAKLQMTLDLEMLKMANAQQISIETIKAQLAMKVMDVNAKHQQQQTANMHAEKSQLRDGEQSAFEQRVSANNEATARAEKTMGEFPKAGE